MARKQQRELTFHRRAQPAQQLEGASAADDSAVRSAEDPDDDLPVSSEQPDADAPRIGTPSHGEMGALPQNQSGADVELSPPYRGDTAARGGKQSNLVEPLLDAWYATYGHPALTTLLRRPNIAAAVAGLTLEGDDRTQIADTEAYPWRCVCALTITAADGTRWLGTGWLAGPRTIITAGHCVYLHRHGGWVRQIEVVPGQSADQRPYGSAIAASFRSVRGWARKRQPAHDYGAIILPADRVFGNLVGYLGYVSLGDDDLHGITLNLCGYPSDRPRGTQWYHARQLSYHTPRTLHYTVESVGGHSGAPAWLVRNGQRYVVGIHTNGATHDHAATRVGPPVFDNISAWRREGA